MAIYCVPIVSIEEPLQAEVKRLRKELEIANKDKNKATSHGAGWAIVWSDGTMNVYKNKADAKHDLPKVPSGGAVKFVKWAEFDDDVG